MTQQNNLDAPFALSATMGPRKWTWTIFSNGHYIVLERQARADPEGYAGLEDQVDYHWDRLFMARVPCPPVEDIAALAITA